LNTNFYIEVFGKDKLLLVAEILDYQHPDYFIQKAIDNFIMDYAVSPDTCRYQYKNKKWINVKVKHYLGYREVIKR